MKSAPPIILSAEDDETDQLLTAEALHRTNPDRELRFVADGRELMEYLERKNKYQDPVSSPRPALILLDLNMPRMGGTAVLEDLNRHPAWSSIPVVVLSTSDTRRDIRRSYELGAAGYVKKPHRFVDLVAALAEIERSWFDSDGSGPSGT